MAARQGMTFVALIGCTGAAGAACFVAVPLLAVLLISVGTFCGMASGVSAYALAISYGGKRVATVFATMNMSGNLGAVISPPIVKALSQESWKPALVYSAAMFFTASLCWLFINPRRVIVYDDADRRRLRELGALD